MITWSSAPCLIPTSMYNTRAAPGGGKRSSLRASSSAGASTAATKCSFSYTVCEYFSSPLRFDGLLIQVH